MLRWHPWLLLAVALLALLSLSGRPEQVSEPHIAQLTVTGAISPATTDYLTRSIEQAKAAGASLVVLKLDTPGGLDAATRDIVKYLLASPVPVALYVYPAGGRAASAGTYILYASHIAAMAPSTSLGAATPIQMAPQQSREQRQEPGGEPESASKDSQSALERKLINDAVAFIRGLALRHGRNADWAELAVREAVSLTAEEALQQQVIEVLAVDIADLLQQIDGRSVQMEKERLVIQSLDLPIVRYDPDWRNELLSLLTNPQVAYLLLLIGIYGLIFEGYNPGALVPGVIGAICLLLALYALQLLPVNYVGLALIILGALLIVAEAMVPSFGILGIGGVIALVFGSVLLFDREIPGLYVPQEFIMAVGLGSSLLVLIILWFLGRNLRMPHRAIEQAMVGRIGVVCDTVGAGVQVRIDGERWSAHSEQTLHSDQQVRVIAQQGLELQVEPCTLSVKGENS